MNIFPVHAELPHLASANCPLCQEHEPAKGIRLRGAPAVNLYVKQLLDEALQEIRALSNTFEYVSYMKFPAASCSAKNMRSASPQESGTMSSPRNETTPY